MINAALAGLFAAKGQYDLIYATSPPLFVGGAALTLSFLRRIPMVFEVRDLWPESASALGELNNKYAIALATKLEEACYRNAQKVIVVTQSVFKRLQQRKIPEEKLILISNGANVDMFRFSQENRDSLRSKYGLHGKFVAIYAGILGVAQGLEVVIQAAKILGGDPDIHFLIVGDGPKRLELESSAERLHLRNLTFTGHLPLEEMPGLLSAADVALIPLRKLDIFTGVLPSKMFDAWSCERPILLSVDGEARKVLEACSGGRYVSPENPQELSQGILDLKENPQTARAMGEAGRQYTVKNYSRKKQAEELIAILAGLTRTG
jgi:glycosyltransferase involved in cell wall biosynthesis